MKDQIKENITERQLNILAYFLEADHDFAYRYDTIQDWTYLSREVLQQEIKILRDWGLIDWVRGLLDDEGYAAGSGFQINYNKISYIRKLLDK